MKALEIIEWPAWRYHPTEKARVFQCAADVPEGWRDRPFTDDEKQAEQPTAVESTEPTTKRRGGRPRKIK